MTFDDWLRKAARFIRWHRRLLAALCVGFGVFATLMVFNAQLSLGQPVMVFTREIQAGEILTSSDVEIRQLTESMIPADAITEQQEATGRKVLLRRSAGSVVTANDLATVSLVSADAGEVLVPVLVRAEILGIIRVGDRIAIINPASADKGELLANAVRVAAIPASSPAGTFSSGSVNGLVLVSTDFNTAQRLAVASQFELNIVLLGDHKMSEPNSTPQASPQPTEP